MLSLIKKASLKEMDSNGMNSRGIMKMYDAFD